MDSSEDDGDTHTIIDISACISLHGIVFISFCQSSRCRWTASSEESFIDFRASIAEIYCSSCIV